MKIVNKSQYPDHLVELLVRFVARELEVESHPQTVKITNTRAVFRGTCWSNRVLLRIGSPSAFPLKDHHYRKRSPIYSLADWREALVALAGHEFWHTRQWRRRAHLAQRTLTHADAAKFRFSEVDCEHSALRMLTLYREKRAELEQQASEIAVREQAKETKRETRKAAANTPEALHAAKFDKLTAAIKRWETKEKLAATKLKKYRRQLKRLGAARPIEETEVEAERAAA